MCTYWRFTATTHRGNQQHRLEPGLPLWAVVLPFLNITMHILSLYSFWLFVRCIFFRVKSRWEVCWSRFLSLVMYGLARNYSTRVRPSEYVNKCQQYKHSIWLNVQYIYKGYQCPKWNKLNGTFFVGLIFHVWLLFATAVQAESLLSQRALHIHY